MTLQLMPPEFLERRKILHRKGKSIEYTLESYDKEIDLRKQSVRNFYTNEFEKSEVKVISSCQGKISKMLLVFKPSWFYIDMFEEIVYQMTIDVKGIQFCILYNENSTNKMLLNGVLKSIEERLCDCGDDFKLQCDLEPIQIGTGSRHEMPSSWFWVQDIILIGQGELDSIYTIQPINSFDENVPNDQYNMGVRLKHLFKTVPSPLYFGTKNLVNSFRAGGNFLLDQYENGERFVLVGYDTLYNELNSIAEADQEFVLNMYSRVFKVKRENIHVIKSDEHDILALKSELESGKTIDGLDFYCEQLFIGIYQPIYHLDLFVTLTGKTRNGRYVIFVGEPTLANENTPIESFAVLKRMCNQIEKDLTASGFEVVRNPLPIIYLDEKKNGGINRKWYAASYNNCVLQIADANSRVWLPAYAVDFRSEYSDQTLANFTYLTKWEEENIALWESINVNVSILPSGHELALLQGGPHCMTKCLQRL